MKNLRLPLTFLRFHGAIVQIERRHNHALLQIPECQVSEDILQHGLQRFRRIFGPVPVPHIRDIIPQAITKDNWATFEIEIAQICN